MQVLKYDEAKKWLTGRSTGTQTMYVLALNHYCDFTTLNPTQLIDEAEEDRAKDRRHRGKPEARVVQFYQWLVNDKTMVWGGYNPKKLERIGFSQKYATKLVGSIQSFYRKNGFPLLIDCGLIPTAAPRKKNKKLDLCIEDIKQLVSHASTLRDKAVILMMFQGGYSLNLFYSELTTCPSLNNISILNLLVWITNKKVA